MPVILSGFSFGRVSALRRQGKPGEEGRVPPGGGGPGPSVPVLPAGPCRSFALGPVGAGAVVLAGDPLRLLLRPVSGPSSPGWPDEGGGRHREAVALVHRGRDPFGVLFVTVRN